MAAMAPQTGLTGHTGAPLLHVQQLGKQFGGVEALTAVGLTLYPGQRHAIIGPNGAGKSTFFHLLAGALTPTHGRILYHGRDITHWPIHKRAQLGISRTFQQNSLFTGLTVWQNVALAVQQQAHISQVWWRARSAFTAVAATGQQLLQQVGLWEYQETVVSELAYGQQRVLEIALALASQPRLLLLDEPTAGMSAAETAQMVQLLQQLPPQLSLIIVEHDMDVIFQLADSITVLHHGRLISQGTADAVRQDTAVQAIYLGEPGDVADR